MARLKENSFTSTPEKLEDLNNPKVLVVDMINGFTKNGALADPAIAEIAPAIRHLVEYAGSDNTLFITDCHAPDCLEFASFPAHCIEGSEESEVMDELKDLVVHRLKKNAINTFTAPGFDQWLSSLPEVCDVIVTGCCTELCVLQLALSLQSWVHQHDQKGIRVFLPVACVDTYDIPGVHDAATNNAFALANMAANGIHVTDFQTE